MSINALNIETTGLQVFDPSTGTFTAIALTTKGDILINDGTSYQRLPVGANDKILVADSAQSEGLSWESVTVTGSMVLLSSQSASSSATIDFTDLDNTTYPSFVFRLASVHPQTDNVRFEILFSIDNGSSFISSGYKWVIEQIDATAGTNSINGSTSDTTIDVATIVGNAAGEGIAGNFWFHPSDNPSTQMKNAIEYQCYYQDTSTGLKTVIGGGTSSTTSTVDAVRFKFSSGNIESGEFFVYGFKDS